MHVIGLQLHTGWFATGNMASLIMKSTISPSGSGMDLTHLHGFEGGLFYFRLASSSSLSILLIMSPFKVFGSSSLTAYSAGTLMGEMFAATILLTFSRDMVFPSAGERKAFIISFPDLFRWHHDITQGDRGGSHQDRFRG